MNYISIYKNLYTKAKNGDYSDEITENHHFIPKSLTNKTIIERISSIIETNDVDVESDVNKGDLSIRAHYLAHWLLVRIFEDDPQIGLACQIVFNENNKAHRKTSRQYEKFRLDLKKYASATLKGWGMYFDEDGNKVRLRTEEAKERGLKGLVPECTTTKSGCDFCGGEFHDSYLPIHIKYHCELNPDKIYLVKEKTPCKYCGKDIGLAGLTNHERSCPQNTDRIEHRCSYCDKLGKSQGGNKTHERYCEFNPDREIRQEKTVGVCVYCNGEYKGLETHQSLCEKNPNRVKRVMRREVCPNCGVSFGINNIKQHKERCIT